MVGCLVQSLGWIRGAADVVGPAARLKMWRHTWSSSPPEISHKPPILPFSSFQPICFLEFRKTQWKSHYQQVELWWESLGVICLSCGCTNSHTIVGPAVIHPQFDNRNSCLSSLPKICTSTRILISKSGGGTTDLFHLFNFPSFPIQSKIAILEKECNCVCIISVCVRRCLLYFCICLCVKGAATVEKEGVWRREKFLTSLAITNTPGSCWRGQQRLFYTLVSQGWKAS